MKTLLAIITLTLLLSGCASVLTVEQAAPEINKPLTEKITIAVIDHRPYILDGDKAASFEGLSRTTIGIPFSRYTYNNKSMSEFLTNRLVAGFNKSGVQALALMTTPKTTIEEVKTIGSKTVVIVLNEWKYDYHAFSDNSWYNFDVIIKDTDGAPLINKNFTGEQDVPSLSINDIQLLYKTRFEKAFSDAEIKAIL
jgi:hypothetical protein